MVITSGLFVAHKNTHSHTNFHIHGSYLHSHPRTTTPSEFFERENNYGRARETAVFFYATRVFVSAGRREGGWIEREGGLTAVKDRGGGMFCSLDR